MAILYGNAEMEQSSPRNIPMYEVLGDQDVYFCFFHVCMIHCFCFADFPTTNTNTLFYFKMCNEIFNV